MAKRGGGEAAEGLGMPEAREPRGFLQLRRLVDHLEEERHLDGSGFQRLIEGRLALSGGGGNLDASLDANLSANPGASSASSLGADVGSAAELDAYVFQKADAVRRRYYGNLVYIRGLIEFTSYCGNDCYYCGLRRGNRGAERYRLTKEEILECCRTGYELGFRTFVLQGGEDPYFTDERMVELISAIRASYGDCAITLSVGEKSRESYQAYFDAGANRYLLRHETADAVHYRRLHPEGMSLESRVRCLYDLKEIGFQVGCGFLVGSPGQTAETLARDMLLLQELQPHMVGIGPFIPHHGTPFADEAAGTAEMTLFLLGLCRLLLPKALLPSTTALGTIHADGRELGILAGANVVMPNLSPSGVRKKYLLYDNKICTGDEAAESLDSLAERMTAIGYEIAVHRGDPIL